ncbi:hypothetical protein HYY73_05950 [Candidatus Woesearchaeota archaeon]|nr:hypothetical protein [Candidatus Woesearchaeota archaeon]
MVDESVEYWRNLPLSDPAKVIGATKGHFCLQVSGITPLSSSTNDYEATEIRLSVGLSNGEKLPCILLLRVGKPQVNERSIAEFLNQNSGKGLEGVVGIRLYGEIFTQKSVGYLKVETLEAVIFRRKAVFYSAAPA